MLDPADWLHREREHHIRVDEFCAPHRRRARAGQKHPVWDFLFTYYSLRPRQLRVWHPGYGVALAGDPARQYLDRAGYEAGSDGVTVSRDYLLSRLDTVAFIARLLRATAGRPMRLNCFGLHEWAMVYRTATPRHDGVPLRLGTAGTDAVVESMPLRCSHFDAFRFFTEPAARRNTERLSRQGQVDTEQPGCLHAAMDLYKWSFKLGPLLESGLVMDCLALAADARELDMRASPYDLREYGFGPIAIETPAGRAEYVRVQQTIADRAAPLRSELADRCERLLLAAGRDDRSTARD
ncbi:3-methyladenine DNA glycosylase [Mycolicibacterium flavescens]|uniref:3-methyladenine DNA glycosylase n=1 Tax=Mycolicibacterium flavescens TaxID=1776 RepID=A0A1E3RAE5_MYCFV|nr:3-methyladenine DNA glycosylase [Mycolicibacterium flavescens]ODQ86799.1 3-methyladenine DNA glycosylase [Mycolicibacterium flavescens]